MQHLRSDTTTISEVPADDRSMHRPARRHESGHRRTLTFVLTFGAGWLALDRLVTSPPTLVSATAALIVAAAALLVSDRLVAGRSPRASLRQLGLGRPSARGLAESAVVSCAVIATFVVGASLLGIDLELRSNWPSVLAAAMIFHGIAEELVWRGFVYAHFRRSMPMRRAVVFSMPLIALTHVPVILSNGVAVGTLAVLTAIVTCIPFARLYDRGGSTIWAPALLHGSIGTWQLFERDFPVDFSILTMCASILTPLSVFAFRSHRPTTEGTTS